MLRRVLPLLALVLFTGCDRQGTSQRSAWGQVHVITQTEQRAAPQVIPYRNQLTTTWIGADDTGVHQDMRVLTPEGLTSTVVLPLPPVHPFDQRIAPAVDGAVHLFWLDDDPETPLQEAPQLFTALVEPPGTVMRGPTQVSETRTLRYAAAPFGQGGVWLVWSGENLVQPKLYAQFVTALGIPRERHHLAWNADFPVLVQSNDGVLQLFWQDAQAEGDKSAYHAVLTNGDIGTVQRLTQVPRLESGDRFTGVSAGLDLTHMYLLWNITRKDGQHEVWMASGAIGSAGWGAPVRLGYQVFENAEIETGFNTGTGQAASFGENAVQWATALAGQYAVLPVAVVTTEGIGLLYLREGLVVGSQHVVDADRVISAPSLVTDRERHLHLTWSVLDASGDAALLLTSTR